MKRWAVLTLWLLLSPVLSNPSPGQEDSPEKPAPDEEKTEVSEQQAAPARSPMPIYIEPFYHFEGLRISTGTFDEDLMDATKDTILALSVRMREQVDVLPVETMYVMSIRLYDLKHKDEATYWFYSAQFRALQLAKGQEIHGPSRARIGSEEFERIHAHSAFRQLAGEYINGHAFVDLKHLKDTIRLVQKEGMATTFRSDLAYPDGGMRVYPPKFVSGRFDKLLEYIETNEAKILELRKKNRMDEKY